MDRFPKLLINLQSILVLSHGQAAVEHGFHLNQSPLRCNMKKMTIVSRRQIKDYMITYNFVPSNARITPELIKSVSFSHNRYAAFLKDQRKEKAKGTADQQALVLGKEIKNCEKKKNNLTLLVESFNGDCVKYSLTAADENDPKKMKEMLVKGCGLKLEADKVEKTL